MAGELDQDQFVPSGGETTPGQAPPPEGTPAPSPGLDIDAKLAALEARLAAQQADYYNRTRQSLASREASILEKVDIRFQAAG